jgi:hypothetical protein
MEKAKELQKLSTTEVERVTKFLYESYRFDGKSLLYRIQQVSSYKLDNIKTNSIV